MQRFTTLFHACGFRITVDEAHKLDCDVAGAHRWSDENAAWYRVTLNGAYLAHSMVTTVPRRA